MPATAGPARAAEELGSPCLEFAETVERAALAAFRELRPGQRRSREGRKPGEWLTGRPVLSLLGVCAARRRPLLWQTPRTGQPAVNHPTERV